MARSLELRFSDMREALLTAGWIIAIVMAYLLFKVINLDWQMMFG